MSSRGSALRTYVIQRLLLMLPTLLGVTFVLFLICQMVPGGPIDQMKMRMAGAEGGGELATGQSGQVQTSFDIPEEQLENLKAYYGFDKPFFVRYGLYLKNLATLNLGDSYRYSKPVTDLIVERFPVSMYFGIILTILYYAISVPLGIYKALNHRRFVDYFTSGLIFLGYSVPGYALGVLLLSYFAVRHDWFPLHGFESAGFSELSPWEKVKDRVHHSALPLVCLGIGMFAQMTVLMKNSLMENMGSDYVKTALAKGMTWRTAVYKHAVRNSLIPLATSFGGNIAIMLTGFLLIEQVFGIPGMGRLSFESIQARDYPVVMGFVFIGAFLSIVGHLISDLCVAAVDPRVRFGSK